MFARKFFAIALLIGLFLFGCKTEKTLEDRLANLSEKNSQTRADTVLALCSPKYQSEKAVRALIGALSDTDPKVRSNAVWSLGEIGKTGKVPMVTLAVPFMIKNVDMFPDLEQETCKALGNFKDNLEAAKFLLESLMKNNVPLATDNAVNALMEVGLGSTNNLSILSTIKVSLVSVSEDPKTPYLAKQKADYILLFLATKKK